MFAPLRSPPVSEVEVVWPDGVTPEWVSKVPPTIFDGYTVNVFALLKQAPLGTIRLQGRASTDMRPVEIGSVACAVSEVGSKLNGTYFVSHA